MIRLGGPVFNPPDDPAGWAQAVRDLGYRAATCPLDPEADDATVAAYEAAAQEHDVVIAEVGAWSNPLSPDEDVRRKAMEKCVSRLELAERIGARCCVNIAGSRGEKWDGPSPLDLTDETFEMIVETVRRIIDAVGPKRTHYALETMPWMYPDSPESYLRVIEAIDRPAFAVHLDAVNLVSSPQRYFANAELIRDCVAKLGPRIVSCHAKDIVLHDRLTTHLDEARPGEGGLDYAVLLGELDRLDGDVPLLMEHLADADEYRRGADYIRGVADREGIEL